MRNKGYGEFSNNTWDELSSFTVSGTVYKYEYDPEGLRIKKVAPSGTTRYFYDNASRVVAESDGTNVTAQIIWGHKPLARKVGSSYYYYLYNGHGDVVRVVDENGNIVNNYTYDEWGNILSQTEGIANPIKYAGEYYDEESGLYYLRARYYDPSIGRFISKDSYEGDITNPLSFNGYAYVLGNPLKYIDPSGYAADSYQLALANWNIMSGRANFWSSLLNGSDASTSERYMESIRDQIGRNTPGLITSTTTTPIDAIGNRLYQQGGTSADFWSEANKILADEWAKVEALKNPPPTQGPSGEVQKLRDLHNLTSNLSVAVGGTLVIASLITAAPIIIGGLIIGGVVLAGYNTYINYQRYKAKDITKSQLIGVATLNGISIAGGVAGGAVQRVGGQAAQYASTIIGANYMWASSVAGSVFP